MAEVALVLWLVYYVLTVGVRVTLQLRRTGRTGLVGIRSRPGSLGWIGELAEGAGLALGVAAPALALGDSVEQLEALDKAGFHAAGVALFVAGLAGIVASQHAMGASWRIGVDPEERTELVTSGPFAAVRNPIFTCIVVVQVGVLSMVPNALALGAVVLTVLSVELQVRFVEEPYLLRVHGDSYAAYARRAGRFLPGLGRLVTK